MILQVDGTNKITVTSRDFETLWLNMDRLSQTPSSCSTPDSLSTSLTLTYFENAPCIDNSAVDWLIINAHVGIRHGSAISRMQRVICP